MGPTAKKQKKTRLFYISTLTISDTPLVFCAATLVKCQMKCLGVLQIPLLVSFPFSEDAD